LNSIPSVLSDFGKNYPISKLKAVVLVLRSHGIDRSCNTVNDRPAAAESDSIIKKMEGIVEVVFDLHGSEKANTAYAWSHATDNPAQPKRHVTVLHIPPAISPETAVRAAIVQEFRNLDATQA
jgi:hypothetical protein